MKTFNTLQELWDYCSYCPICKNDHRNMIVSVGPDNVFSLVDLSKDKNFIHLHCRYRNKSNTYGVNYNIDCQDNTFDVSVADLQITNQDNRLPPIKVKRAYFYFYIQSTCTNCGILPGASAVYSSDLELDMLNNKVVNIALERESYTLFDGVAPMRIGIYHDSGLIKITPDLQGTIELPMMQLDLSDQAKVIQKIKTLTMFI